jgi:hypothetical protein
VDINNRNRARRYRRLAVAEPDECKSALLRKLAEEAERGVLCTVDHMGKSSKTTSREGSR